MSPLSCQLLKVFSGLITSVFLLSGCQTLTPSKNGSEPPKIVYDMPLKSALEAAVQYGGTTLNDVKRLVTKRNEWPAATTIVNDLILAGATKLDDSSLINAVHLYQAAPITASPALVSFLVGSARPLARQLGWHIASSMPSRAVGEAVEKELTRALKEGDDVTVLIPEMATAVRVNHLKGTYTLMREGLMSTGHEAFAEAMASLDPSQASYDFMDYLSRASLEELRQLNVKSINMYAALVALRHMLSSPPSLAHPSAEYLFFYAISRNAGLADMANSVLETAYFPKDRSQLALILSRQQVWVQLAYVEVSRTRQSPAVALFLSELRQVATQQEVVEEIDEWRRF